MGSAYAYSNRTPRCRVAKNGVSPDFKSEATVLVHLQGLLSSELYFPDGVM